MKRKETEPLEQRTMNFYKGDFGRLQDLAPRLGAAKVVRMLVRSYIRRVESKAAQNLPPPPIVEIE